MSVHRRGTVLEESLALQVQAVGLPAPEREVCLVPGRRFRCDFVWRPQRLVVEVEGGLYGRGRHTRIGGFIRDCEKYNTLILAGWRLLRVTERDIRIGRAVGWVEAALRS